MNDVQRFENRNTIETVPYGKTPSCQTPSAMIELAITRGADLEKLEKLMELQEKWDKNEAKKSYVEAMAKFKAEPPKIEKDKRVQYSTTKGPTDYNHASLANVTEKINKALSIQGLSAAWSTSQSNGNITVTCTITHKAGHSESTSLIASPDLSGSKNAIQAIGSTISYLERYTLLALTGLATHDMDDDGNVTDEIEYINKKQISSIIDYIYEKEADQTKFLKYMNAESLKTILASDFDKAIKALKAKKKPEREPGDES